MTTPPKEPRAIGGQFNYARRFARYARQRLATGTNGSVTTMGYIPPRTKNVQPSRNPPSSDARWS